MVLLGMAREAHSYTQFTLRGGSLDFSALLLCLHITHGSQVDHKLPPYSNVIS